MKTDQLIAALAADAKSSEMPIGRALLLAVTAGAVGAVLLFFVSIGPRPDLAAALETPRFLFKWVVTLTLFASAAGLVWHLARPGAVPSAWVTALVAAPLLLALASLIELARVPASAWAMEAVGKNSLVCMVLIPILSAAPLVAVILALRYGATTRPVLAGGAAGLLAAGIGTTLYATHCQDDSPLFLAVWYVIAVAIVTLLGALLGGRLLRW